MGPEQLESDDYAALLTAARAGDASSFWRMCEGLRPQLRQLAAYHLDPELAAKVDASDIVQDALTAAVSAFPSFRGQCRAEWDAWLTQIVKHEVLDVRRHWHQPRRSVRSESARADQEGAGFVSDGSSPSAQSQRDEQANAVMALLCRLPEDEQAVVRMRHFEGKPLAEISHTIGRTPAATAGVLKRAMARLRQMLPDGPNGSPPEPV